MSMSPQTVPPSRRRRLAGAALVLGLGLGVAAPAVAAVGVHGIDPATKVASSDNRPCVDEGITRVYVCAPASDWYASQIGMVLDLIGR